MDTRYDRPAAIAVGFFLLLLVLVGFPRDTTTTVPETCGTVYEEGTAVPASCYTLDELDARLDAIHAERSGGRFDADRQECAELLAADDPDAGTCWTRFPGLEAPESWGDDRDPETTDTEVRP